MDVGSELPAAAEREVDRSGQGHAMPGRRRRDHGEFVGVLIGRVEEGARALAVVVIAPHHAVAGSKAALHTKLQSLINVIHARHEGLGEVAILRIRPQQSRQRHRRLSAQLPRHQARRQPEERIRNRHIQRRLVGVAELRIHKVQRLAEARVPALSFRRHVVAEVHEKGSIGLQAMEQIAFHGEVEPVVHGNLQVLIRPRCRARRPQVRVAAATPSHWQNQGIGRGKRIAEYTLRHSQHLHRAVRSLRVPVGGRQNPRIPENAHDRYGIPRVAHAQRRLVIHPVSDP